MEPLFDSDMKHSAQQHTYNPDMLMTWARTTVLRELLTGTLSVNLSPEDIADFRLQAESYQIVICEDFNSSKSSAPYSFADLLKVTNKDNSIFEHIKAGSHDVVLLKGSLGSKRLEDFVEHFKKQNPQEGSPLGSIFLAYGRPVSSLENLHFSYEDALALLRRRFFCAKNQHTLGYHALSIIPSTPPHKYKSLTLDDEAVTKQVTRLIGYIQSYNRNMVTEMLARLETSLSGVSDDIVAIKLFLIDLYLYIKDHISHNYTHVEIPFEGNSAAIKYIASCNYLYEIMDFLSDQFEIIMQAIGNPSRETILDDVLFYIDHNYMHNIKLETIALLFGYNSAYLGKIFSKTVGESFNTYIDHKRIEYSKKLLLENRLKVYEIAQQSGYKNVDYFHKKFKKYVGKSPAEYRKQARP